jgi:tetratricopeptide (TPR) repeat protein
MLRSQEDVRPPFIGRVKELELFREQVLRPDEPSAHLLSIWGPLGVGTSALLAQLHKEAHTDPFQSQCLTAFVNARMKSPLLIMIELARQFRVAGTPLVAFEQLLDYTTKMPALPPSLEQQVARVLFVQRVQDLAQTETTQGTQMIGGMYETVSEANRTEFLSQHLSLEIYDLQNFLERLVVLTRTFIEDLNWLASTPVSSAAGRGKRIILFLDNVVPTSSVVTWLRTQVLPAAISKQIVLVVAGEDSLQAQASLPTESSIISLPLHPFTQDETRNFLAAYGITNADQIALLWQKTGGLPLLLRLLAPVPFAHLQTDEQAMTIAMQWIEQQGSGYRYLLRYAALFSRSFRPSDLAVCPVFSAQDCIRWYRILIALPFVQRDIVTGEYTYHPLVQQHLCLIFAQEARPAYQQARQALALFYQQQLAHVHPAISDIDQNEPAEARQELTLALVEQWLRLADETGLQQAIMFLLSLIQQIPDHMALIDQLQAFVEESSISPLPAQSKHVAELLLTYCRADLKNPAFQSAITGLLEILGQQATIPVSLLAHLYSSRAAAWLLQGQPQQALDDSMQAAMLDPTCTDSYLLHGIAAAASGMLTDAIAAFHHVITLDVRNIFAYAHRSLAYRDRKAYEQAIEDINQVLILTPNLPEAARFRNLVYEEMDKARRGLGDFDYQLELYPDDKDAYVLQAMAHTAIGQYDQALASFEQALSLDPTDPRIYAGRGHIHLERADLEMAQEDLLRSWELDSRDETTGMLLAWVRLCLDELDEQINPLLERFATGSSQQNIALTSRGILLIRQQQFAQAVEVFEQVLQHNPTYSEAAFWKGLACAFLEQDAVALAALEEARSGDIPLPAVLFTPLRWVAQTRPDFYQEQLLPFVQIVPQ